MSVKLATLVTMPGMSDRTTGQGSTGEGEGGVKGVDHRREGTAGDRVGADTGAAEVDSQPDLAPGRPVDARSGWFALALTAFLALASVGTAWAGFQSAKWSGVQSNLYAEASTARTESARRSALAGQLLTIDVISFTQWLTALNQEIIADPSRRLRGTYIPDSNSVSGFLFGRFREEFKPAVMAWLDTRPLANPKAPPTPFVMPQYRVAAQTEAVDLASQAEQRAADARAANQRSDNYVLTAVLFALVLFFVAFTDRARGPASRFVLFGLTAATLAGAAVLLATFPVTV
jgi:hypothetical protein